jgi:hypothetical protein
MNPLHAFSLRKAYLTRSRSVRLLTMPSTVDVRKANRTQYSKCETWIFGICRYGFGAGPSVT